MGDYVHRVLPAHCLCLALRMWRALFGMSPTDCPDVELTKQAAPWSRPSRLNIHLSRLFHQTGHGGMFAPVYFDHTRSSARAQVRSVPRNHPVSPNRLQHRRGVISHSLAYKSNSHCHHCPCIIDCHLYRFRLCATRCLDLCRSSAQHPACRNL
jgi:AraC-like DNA-binding protein